jgi:hypothetical protein
MSVGGGVHALVHSLREVQRRFELDVIAGTRELRAGEHITVRLTGLKSTVLELENENGEFVVSDLNLDDAG